MKKRCIYSYEFEDNSVYIGLTCNIGVRQNNHKKYGSVYEHSLICKKFIFIQLTDFMNDLIAKEKEIYYVEKYKNDGWKILNKTGAGGLGGNILKWDKKTCREEALKYKTKAEFQKSSPGCYKRCRIEGWLKELTKHMENGYIVWTKEKCLEDCKNYNSYSDYRKNSKSYQFSMKFKFLNEICDYFGVKKQHYKNYWTKENCQKEALKYKFKKDFFNLSRSAYHSAKRNGFLDEICSHMISIKKDKKYWTKERCHKEALKYYHMKDFQNKSGGSYHKCLKNNWLEEISTHMNYKKRKNTNFWTKKNCQEEALKYDKRSNFAYNSKGAYKSAIKHKWLNEICSHMKKSHSKK